MEEKCSGMSIPLNTTNVYSLQFADDQAIILEDRDALAYTSRTRKKTYHEWKIENHNLQIGSEEIKA